MRRTRAEGGQVVKVKEGGRSHGGSRERIQPLNIYFNLFTDSTDSGAERVMKGPHRSSAAAATAI